MKAFKQNVWIIQTVFSRNFYSGKEIENKTEAKLMQTNIEYNEQYSDTAVYLFWDVSSYNSCCAIM